MAPSFPYSYHSAYYATSRTDHSREAARAKVDRIIALIDLSLKCLLPLPSSAPASALPQTSSLLPCRLLLANVLKDATPVADKFRDIYTPLLTRLKATLPKYGRDLTLNPFKDVVRGLTGLYMDKFMGTKDEPFLHPSIKKVGCGNGGNTTNAGRTGFGVGGVGCYECRGVDQWLVNPKGAREYQLRANEPIRRHVESQLGARGGSEFLTWTTIRTGSPHTLSITKKDEVENLARWDRRVKEARSFLRVIGHEEECRRVLGEREWQGIQDIMDGKKITVGKPAGPSTGTAAAAGGRVNRIKDAAPRGVDASARGETSTATRGINIAASASQAGLSSRAGAGQKRKRDPNRPVVRGSEVIDLTGFSP